jgi:hypothetical protein
MKRLSIIFGFLATISACKSDIIVPEKLIGKWNHAYQVQYKTSDGTWGPWNTFVTIAAIPPIEFTAKGKFLRDGKPGAECCTAGNKFTVLNNTIIFSDLKNCPQMSCLPESRWEITRLDSDTLVVETMSIRNKYIRIK